MVNCVQTTFVPPALELLANDHDIPPYSSLQVTPVVARMIVVMGLHNLNTMGMSHETIVTTLEKCLPPVYLRLCCLYLEGFYQIVTFEGSSLVSEETVKDLLKKAQLDFGDVGKKNCIFLISRVKHIHRVHQEAGEVPENDYTYLKKVYETE